MNHAPSSLLEPPTQTSLADHEHEQHPAEPVHISHFHTFSVQPVAVAAWHAFLWLVIGNAIGVMLALLLLVPSLNASAWRVDLWALDDGSR